VADTVGVAYEPTEVAVRRVRMIANSGANNWWQDYCPCSCW